MLIYRIQVAALALVKGIANPKLTLYRVDSRVESTEDYSAYSESAMIGGQKPALKRTMRANAELYEEPKICLKVIG